MLATIKSNLQNKPKFTIITMHMSIVLFTIVLLMWAVIARSIFYGDTLFSLSSTLAEDIVILSFYSIFIFVVILLPFIFRITILHLFVTTGLFVYTMLILYIEIGKS